MLNIELPWMIAIGRPKTPQRLPEVLTISEVLRTRSLMQGDLATLATLLHGTEMHNLEAQRYAPTACVNAIATAAVNS